MKRLLILTIITNCLCGYFGAGLISQENDEYRFLMLFSNILNHVKSNYYENVPAEVLYQGAVKGILQELDPHTQYLSPFRFDRFTQISNGLSYGVGIEFEIIDDQPTVISVISGSSADRKNIKTGDILIAIDGQELMHNMSTADLMLMLYGEENSTIVLMFDRNGDHISTALRRRKLEMSSIPIASVVRPGIGYIRCTNFSTSTTRDFEKAAKALLRKKANHLIIDLRNNPGGILSSAIEISDLFLPEGKLIASTTGRKDQIIKEYISCDGKHFGIPLTILTNSGTASASEVLAGCLQDHGRASIVGASSFGKGLIQTTFLLDNGGALLMTIGEYRTPSGRTIQRTYKGKSFQEYYEETNVQHQSGMADEGDSTLNIENDFRGGIHPDVFVAKDSILDSLDYSTRLRDFLTKKSVALIKEIESTFKDFDSFRLFDQNKIVIDDSISYDSQFADLLKLTIKAEVAGMLWGENEKFDVLKGIDNQLTAAVNAVENSATMESEKGFPSD